MRSLRVRLALVVFAITLGAAGIIYGYVVPPLQDELRDRKLESLLASARGEARALGPVLDAPRTLRRAVTTSSDRLNARVTVLRLPAGPAASPEVVADSATGPEPPADLTFGVARKALRSRGAATGTAAGSEGRVGQAARVVRESGQRYGVVLSAPLRDVQQSVASIRERILVAVGLALPAALAAGFLVAGALSRRIKRLERSARRVARGDFTARFPAESDDELGRLARALDDMQRQLSELDSARKRFIATASHELRTPLFSLSGFLELLDDEELDEEERARFVAQVRQQVRRLVKLATDLLDLSRLEAGSLELRTEETDLGNLARAVTSEFEPALAAHESRLELRLSGRRIEADVDPERVAQILRILIDNALTHTQPGTDMVVTAGRRDGRVQLAVRDYGGGLRRQQVEQIFEPFYTSDDAQGSGLGLAIARELADRMEGTLTADASAGRTTFTLELPS